jgi:hypothetical protein
MFLCLSYSGRTQPDRLLDPSARTVTLETLEQAANFLGRKVRVECV